MQSQAHGGYQQNAITYSNGQTLSILAYFSGSIQSSYADRVKRKSQLEGQVKQMSERLVRAQALSYSLEEESQRWKQTLMDVEKSLKVLIGNSIIGAMMVAYGGCMRQTERQMSVEKWRNICHR